MPGFWDAFGQQAQQGIAQGPAFAQAMMARKRQNLADMLRMMSGIGPGEGRKGLAAQLPEHLQGVGQAWEKAPLPPSEQRAQTKFDWKKGDRQTAEGVRAITAMDPLRAAKMKETLIMNYGQDAWNRAFPTLQAKAKQEVDAAHEGYQTFAKEAEAKEAQRQAGSLAERKLGEDIRRTDVMEGQLGVAQERAGTDRIRAEAAQTQAEKKQPEGFNVGKTRFVWNPAEGTYAMMQAPQTQTDAANAYYGLIKKIEDLYAYDAEGNYEKGEAFDQALQAAEPTLSALRQQAGILNVDPMAEFQSIMDEIPAPVGP